MEHARLNIAVVGAGISGVAAAWLLSKKHNVTLFEKNNRLGGHTNTVVISEGEDQGTPVDTGFIVLNDKTYPNFHRFLAELDVSVRPSCMSFGYYCQKSGFCYAGTGLNGLFARRINAVSNVFWSMLLEIRRFSQLALQSFSQGALDGVPLGAFLEQGRFSASFRRHYLLPISASIWSSGDKGILEFPAEMFVRFFNNHGLLSMQNRPQWQTIVGGSHAYLRVFEQRFTGKIRSASPITSIERNTDGVLLRLPDGEKERFDKVVIAAHADEALAMLADPSRQEQEALGAWSYSKNRTVLHTHAALLPPMKRAWASWNYLRTREAEQPSSVAVTYYMNRLQGLETKNPYCVSLNPGSNIPDEKVVREIEYTHPIYSLRALRSQDTLKKLSGERNTYYCGAHLGSGFHEDGMNSAIEAAAKLGVPM